MEREDIEKLLEAYKIEIYDAEETNDIDVIRFEKVVDLFYNIVSDLETCHRIIERPEGIEYQMRAKGITYCIDTIKIRLQNKN